VHRFAYLPFSLGTRSCIGANSLFFLQNNNNMTKYWKKRCELTHVALCVVVWNVVTGEKLAMLEIKVITVMVRAPALYLVFGHANTPAARRWREDSSLTVCGLPVYCHI
jgi:hypothetical protein